MGLQAAHTSVHFGYKLGFPSFANLLQQLSESKEVLSSSLMAYHKEYWGAGEQAQSVKCLPIKLEDLSSDL